ncbi:unnamed protein product [Vicia faba]|uniref:DUF4408 domain-containing protein n=1 Tax=Vicia faba TaxID=3906 RepID=A0AAV1AKL2_VICFA|nr:unnamed protein product [Vicia faba]
MADPTSFIATWFTPSSIFIFVNLVIGTIALTSRFNAPPKNQTNQQHQQQPQPQLNRSPSLLQRVRSFNLSYYTNNHHNESEPESESTQPQLVRQPSLLQRVVSFHFNKHEPQHPQTHYTQPESDSESTQPQLVRKPSLLQRVMSFKTQQVQPESENLSPNQICDEDKSKVEMKKSASKKECSMTSEWKEEDEETVERRMPATAAARSESTTSKEDEAVDAKADDFINRFKKQLRLQRLDSFIRYRNTM